MTPSTVFPIFLTLTGCSALQERFMEEPEAVAWEDQVIELTQGDLADLQSVRFTDALNSVSVHESAIETRVRLFDGDGSTSVDIMISERGVSSLQRMTAAEQTAEMHELHATVLSAIKVEALGAGWFGNRTAPPVSLDAWVAERGGSDLVVSVGFSRGPDSHLYATVYGDRVEFDPNAPKASGPTSSVAALSSPIETKKSAKEKKEKGGKGFFDSAMKGLEMAQKAADTYKTVSGN